MIGIFKESWRKLFVCSTVAIALNLFFSPHAFAALQSYSPQTSPKNLRDRFDTDLFTGGASYTYDLKIPRGTNDLTPHLSLSYNSHAAKDTKFRVGSGWQISQDYIELDTNYTPANTNDDKFKLYFQGNVYDLVYNTSDNRYHTKIESYLHISKLTGGANDYGDYWQIITPDGIKYRFGQSSNSELVCNGRNFVYTWNLDQITDTHDNKIYFTYSENNGSSFLTQIKYNNDQTRVIDINYETNTYERIVNTIGCSVQELAKLNNIQIRANNALVRKYEFTYTSAGNNQPLLSTIIEKGTDGATALPPTTFTYKPEIKTWQTQGSKWLDHANIDTHLNMNTVTMADVNGDGFTDIVRTTANPNSRTSWKVLLNLGNDHWSSTFQNWVNDAFMEDARLDRTDVRLTDMNGDNLPDIVMANDATVWHVWRNLGSNWSTNPENWGDLSSYGDVDLQNPTVALTDVTGDGLADVVYSLWNGQREYRVFRNLGNKFSTNFEVWSFGGIYYGLEDASVRIADVTGDGLADLVKTTYSASTASWYVWKNHGNGWSIGVETWINNADIDAHLQNTDTTLVDVNGDGLADIIRSFDGGLSDQWKVLMNLGNRWSTTYETWIPASANLDLDAHNNTVRMADVTGDGLVDIIDGRADCSCSYDTWKVWKNNGFAPMLLASVTNSEGGKMYFDYARTDKVVTEITDSTGFSGQYFNNQTLAGTPVVVKNDNTVNFNWYNGSPDASVPADHFSVRWTQTKFFTGGSYIFNTRADDGVRVFVDGEKIIDDWNDHGPTNNTGSKSLREGTHAITVEYYDNVGGSTISFSYQKIGLPFPLWQVSQMTVNNGLTNSQQTNAVTSYEYRNAFYKFENHEFCGFGDVITTDPNSSRNYYYFNQDTITKGKLTTTQRRTLQGYSFSAAEHVWSTTVNNNIYTVNMIQEKQYTYDGTPANPKVLQTDYAYDSFGNLAVKSERGEMNLTGDERFLYTDYTINTNLWMINKPKHTYLKKADNTSIISESFLYYDNHANWSDAPTKGDLTAQVTINTTPGGSHPTTYHTYDSSGNRLSTIDPNNHATTTAYDTTTHTYPVSVTNAKNQITQFSYDLGTGNLLSQTDPNGFVTTNEYDIFGRITKEIKPYDSSSYPTTHYTYLKDGIAPEGVLVAKRETAGQQLTLDTYTWTDGFERTIQTRSEAENPQEQVVTNMYYTPAGQVSKTSAPHFTASSTQYTNPETNTRFIQTTYDVLDRPITVNNYKGDNKTIVYDHWKETTTDENGHIRKETKNAFGKTVLVEEVNNTQTYMTNYTYDARDFLTSVTDYLNNTLQLTYDSLGRRISQTDPDMGTWHYEYDLANNMVKQKDNRNIEIIKTYDELNRVTNINYPNDTDTTFTYDQNGKIGTLSQVTDAAGTIQYVYDNRLRKIQEQRTTDNTTWTTQYAYDSLDHIIQKTYPGNEQLTYGFNAQGQIDNVQRGGSSLIGNFDYNALTKITQKAFANGLTTNYTYNTTDFRLQNIQTGSLQNLSYTYDGVGNITTIANSVTNKTQTFGYDNLDRLTSASDTGGTTFTYVYNAIGNLLQFVKNGTTIDYTYGQNAGVHALTSSTETVSPTPLPSTLLSQNKPIVASAALQNYPATDANDGVVEGSYWEAPENSYPATLTVDLQQIYEIDKVVMKLDWGTRTENVEILTSTDNTTFTTRVAATNYEIGTVPVTFTPTLARYVRLKINSNSGASGAQMAEFEVWGRQSGNSTPTPTPQWTELLGTTWTLTGNDGSDEKDKSIPLNTLNGKTTLQVTFNLHGTSFGQGDDEASIVFVQNDWRAANVITNGAQNGLDGQQTITIPLANFHKVGDTNVVLDPSQNVSNLHARFWNSGAFTVDITSVKVQ